MQIRQTIYETFDQVAKEQKKAIKPLSDDLVLLESGLDSLCFAIIVVRLEDSLNDDPFSAADDIQFPVTLGDFVGLYSNAKH